jgi:hypothetical protein
VSATERYLSDALMSTPPAPPDDPDAADGPPPSGTTGTSAATGPTRPELAPQFIVERNRRSFVLYAGLIDYAHQLGLRGITTALIQVPTELNGQVAIVFATVETVQGTFTGLGDASPQNVNRQMTTALIRLAETRAKARALRDACNIGVVALEELAEGEDSRGGEAAQGEPDEDLRPGPLERAGERGAGRPAAGPPPGQDPKSPATEQQRSAIVNLSRTLRSEPPPLEGVAYEQASRHIAELQRRLRRAASGQDEDDQRPGGAA